MKSYLYVFPVIFCLLIRAGLNDGYIAYCPCMGRFGNQADHFLGSLAFAKATNRTLILPPWVEYRIGHKNSIQIPFDTYFKVEPLLKYHHVITMELFMETIAPTLWPPEKRIAFCYTDRGEGEGCHAKEGNPFGPFWDTFGVDFIASKKYGPLNFDVHHKQMGEKWREKYPAKDYPVLAFVGAPASFPVQLENRMLHQYLVWSDLIADQAKKYIDTLPKGSIIGIHLRNGIDWVRACEHVPSSPNLFAAPQCLGYNNEHGPATMEMCYPSKETIVRLLKRLIRNLNDVKAIFVASDSNHMISELTEALKRNNVSVHKLEKPNPHVDLAILGQVHHFVGNCISSFSAFVKRERDVRGFKSSFWGFPPEKKTKKHDEL